MRFLVQRVLQGSCKVESKLTGEIGRGYVVFIGIEDSDTKEIADRMIDKLLNLRIFEDAEGKTNLNLSSVHGSLLLISQFTLYADCHHGNRPSFIQAGGPALAEELYNYIIQRCKAKSRAFVATGQFGADMKISLVNDGPFTIMLDSDELFGKKNDQLEIF